MKNRTLVMKNRTMAMITAAIITVSAIILTAGLSLLHSSAIGESPIPAESAVPEASAIKEIKNDSVVVIPPDVGDSGEDLEKVLYWEDIIIDIYEQSTGKLVGQVEITDDEVYAAYGELFDDNFDPGMILFDPDDPDDPNDPASEPVCLPESKYRVEAYAIEEATLRSSNGVFEISYSYGVENNEIWEFTQTGLTFGGGAEFIAKLDSLIADEMAKIEAGTAVVPEKSMAEILGLDGYWNGVYFEETGDFYEGVDRYTPRFPYLED